MSFSNQSPEFLSENKKILNDSEEINLIDYFLVLWKRKIAVVSIVLVIVIAAIAINLLLPPTFEAESLVKIGTFKNTPIESVNDIKAIFYSDIMLSQINERLNLQAENVKTIAGLFDIEQKETSENGGVSNFIHIKARGESPEKAQQAVKVVNELLLERHKGLFKEAEEKFNLEVELIKREQEQIKIKINKKEQEIKRLEDDISFYEREISKRSDIQSEGQGRIVESYINLLASVKSRREADLSTLENLKLELINFDARFQAKDFEKKYETKPTSVEIEPVVPKNKIAPARRKNVTIIAILAIFLSIFYAFIAEYISENSIQFKKIKQNNKLTTL